MHICTYGEFCAQLHRFRFQSGTRQLQATKNLWLMSHLIVCAGDNSWKYVLNTGSYFCRKVLSERLVSSFTRPVFSSHHEILVGGKVSLLWAIIIPNIPGSIILYDNQSTGVFFVAQSQLLSLVAVERIRRWWQYCLDFEAVKTRRSCRNEVTRYLPSGKLT